MKLNRKWILLAALVLSVAMATTGTLAYLTDQDADVNTMTLGKVEIVQNEQQRVEADGEFTSTLEPFENDKMLLPVTYPGDRTADTVTIGDHVIKLSDNEANYIDKIVTVTNTGNTNAYVRTLVALPTGGADWEASPVAANDAWLHWNLPLGYDEHWTLNATNVPIITVDGVNYYVWEFTHTEPVKPDETTYPMIRGAYMDKRVDMDDDGNYVLDYGNGTVRTIETDAITDSKGKVNILVLSQAVQADGFASAEAALNEAFPRGDDNANVGTWFNGWTEEKDIGSPGDKWPNNNPPSLAKVTTYDAGDELKITKDNGDEVTIIGKGLEINTNGSFNWGMELGLIPLDVAFKFEPTETAEEAAASEYAEWHADYVVSSNKNIPAAGIGLAGFYEKWCSYNDYAWVLLASESDAIPAGQEIRLVETLGATVNYKEICEFGNDGIGFLCGAVALDGFTYNGNKIDAELEAGTTITVELRLYEADGGQIEDETGEFITVGTYTYTFN